MVESSGSGTSPARDAGAFRNQQSQQFGQVGQERQRQDRSDRDRSDGSTAGSDQSDGGVLNKVKQKASEFSSAVAEKTKDLVEEGRNLAQKSKESVKEWAHTAGEKVDEARTGAGEGLERFGGAVREKGGSAAAVVGGKLEAAGLYLREHDFAGMNESVKEVVRRHPVQSVLVGIGLGFVLARAMRRG